MQNALYGTQCLFYLIAAVYLHDRMMWRPFKIVPFFVMQVVCRGESELKQGGHLGSSGNGYYRRQIIFYSVLTVPEDLQPALIGQDIILGALCPGIYKNNFLVDDNGKIFDI